MGEVISRLIATYKLWLYPRKFACPFLGFCIHTINLFKTNLPIAPIGILDSLFHLLDHSTSQVNRLNPKLITNTQLAGKHLYDLLVNLVFIFGFFITFLTMKGKPVFKPVFNIFYFLTIIYLINTFLNVHIFSDNLSIDSIYSNSNISMTGITLYPTSPFRSTAHKVCLVFNQNTNTNDLWNLTEFETLKIIYNMGMFILQQPQLLSILCSMGLFVLLFSIFLYLNYKLYLHLKMQKTVQKG